MNENKFSGLSLTVIALLLVAIVGTGVYAYYASGISGTANVVTSEYIVKVNGADSVAADQFVITLNGDGTNDDVIAPGEYVAVPITIDPTGSEVDIDYSIRAAYTTNEDAKQITNLAICLAKPNNDGTCGADHDDAIHLTGTTEVSLYNKVRLARTATASPVIYLTWPYGTESSVTTDNEDQSHSAEIIFTVDAEQVLAGVDNQIRG